MFVFLDVLIKLLTVVALQVRIVFKATRKIVSYSYRALDEFMRLKVIQRNLEAQCEHTIGK